MTIVVWDGKVLACDSLITEGGRYSWCEKFWRTENGVYAGCGAWTNLRRIVRELSNGREPDDDLFNRTSAVHLDVKGKLWLYEDADP